MHGLRGEAGLKHEDIARLTGLNSERVSDIEREMQLNEGYIAEAGLYIQACRQHRQNSTAGPA